MSAPVLLSRRALCTGLTGWCALLAGCGAYDFPKGKLLRVNRVQARETERAWRLSVTVDAQSNGFPEGEGDFSDVTVLGYHVLPEQTAPGQARLQFEEQAQKKLDDLGK